VENRWQETLIVHEKFEKIQKELKKYTKVPTVSRFFSFEVAGAESVNNIGTDPDPGGPKINRPNGSVSRTLQKR